MSARFEVVRANADQNGKEWHGRFVVNGRIVWHTPRLSRKVGVERAIESICSVFYGYLMHDKQGVTSLSHRNAWDKSEQVAARIEYVDERTKP